MSFYSDIHIDGTGNCPCGSGARVQKEFIFTPDGVNFFDEETEKALRQKEVFCHNIATVKCCDGCKEEKVNQKIAWLKKSPPMAE